MREKTRVFECLAALLLLVCSAAGPNARSRPLPSGRRGSTQPDRLAQLRARFDKESDPVRRAKLMVPLGTAEFDRVEKEMADNNLDAALEGVREYEGQASSCVKALDARGVDAEKHPNGYKELEISVRESLRRLDNLMVGLAGDEQKPFRDVRSSLDELNRHLISELFPKTPGGKPGD